MSENLSQALQKLIQTVRLRHPLGQEAPPSVWVTNASGKGKSIYVNRNEKLNIDFTVDRIGFPETQTMDPRLLHIAPGKNNELHRHAHESLFVVLAGAGDIRLGDHWTPIKAQDIIFVPRWIVHQTRNTATTEELVILAITDFGFTSAVLGDYDRHTRLTSYGDNSQGS